MAYSIPQNKDAFLKLCEESGTSFPYSEDISCLAKDILASFLSAEFEDGGRHALRVDMMMDFENK